MIGSNQDAPKKADRFEKSQGSKQAGSLDRPATGQGWEVIDPAPVEIRESLWLLEIRQGHTVKEIARREGLSRRRIEIGIASARSEEKQSRERRLHRFDVANTQTASCMNEEGDIFRDWGSPRKLPRLLPHFPVGPFVPSSTCSHDRHPIPSGSVFCCMVCSRSGMDDHPALKRDPRDDPKPEPEVSSEVDTEWNAVEAGKGSTAPDPPRRERHANRPETRKERRRRLRDAKRTA